MIAIGASGWEREWRGETALTAVTTAVLTKSSMPQFKVIPKQIPAFAYDSRPRSSLKPDQNIRTRTEATKYVLIRLLFIRICAFTWMGIGNHVLQTDFFRVSHIRVRLHYISPSVKNMFS